MAFPARRESIVSSGAFSKTPHPKDLALTRPTRSIRVTDSIRHDEPEESEPRIIFLAFANARIEGRPYLGLPDEGRAIRDAFAKLESEGKWKVVERANATLDDIVKVF